jgi:hypothetical protein
MHPCLRCAGQTWSSPMGTSWNDYTNPLIFTCGKGKPLCQRSTFVAVHS